MKTNEKKVLTGIATSIGKAAGFVEGTLETVREPAHEHDLVHTDIHFEDTDVSSRAVFITGVSVFAGTWIAIGILYFLFTFLAHEKAENSPPPLPVAGTSEALPPRPRLQQSPPRDLKAMRASEDWELNNYHWLDKTHTRLVIPIEQAMRLTAQRGIPAANLPPNPTNTPPLQGSRLTGFEGKVEPEPR